MSKNPQIPITLEEKIQILKKEARGSREDDHFNEKPKLTVNEKQIYIKYARFKKFPVIINKFSELEELSVECIRDCGFSHLPLSFYNNTNLQILSLGDSSLKYIDPEISKFKKLKELDLSSNNLSKIPNEINKLKNLKKLYLENLQIEEFPNIFEIKNLELIALANNKIHEIPAKIGQLENLLELELSENEIQELPDEIAQLKRLKELSLTANKIDKFPLIILKITSLAILDISYNEIHKIPAKIAQLENLLELKLSHNKIQELPDEIGQLKQLIELIIYENNIINFPPGILKIKSLKILDMTKTGISKIPREINQLEILSRLLLADNKIREIPDEIGQLKQLVELNLERNLIRTIPDEINKKNLEKLAHFYFEGNQIISISKSIFGWEEIESRLFGTVTEDFLDDLKDNGIMDNKYIYDYHNIIKNIVEGEFTWRKGSHQYSSQSVKRIIGTMLILNSKKPVSKEPKFKNCLISTLPKEILLEIFSFLPKFGTTNQIIPARDAGVIAIPVFKYNLLNLSSSSEDSFDEDDIGKLYKRRKSFDNNHNEESSSSSEDSFDEDDIGKLYKKRKFE